MTDPKDIKRQIRQLKKLKKDMQKKSKERRETNAKIRDLKKMLENIRPTAEDPEKKKIIEEIVAFNKIYHPYLLKVENNYYSYTVEQLRFHLERMKRRY